MARVPGKSLQALPHITPCSCTDFWACVVGTSLLSYGVAQLSCEEQLLLFAAKPNWQGLCPLCVARAPGMRSGQWHSLWAPVPSVTLGSKRLPTTVLYFYWHRVHKALRAETTSGLKYGYVQHTHRHTHIPLAGSVSSICSRIGMQLHTCECIAFSLSSH